MPNFTPEEIEDMRKPLHVPAEADAEYGHRGRITAGSISAQKTAYQTDRWVLSAAEAPIGDVFVETPRGTSDVSR